MNNKYETKININLNEINDNLTLVKNLHIDEEKEYQQKLLWLFIFSFGSIICFIMN